jgi:hypothetical protein
MTTLEMVRQVSALERWSAPDEGAMREIFRRIITSLETDQAMHEVRLRTIRGHILDALGHGDPFPDLQKAIGACGL